MVTEVSGQAVLESELKRFLQQRRLNILKLIQIPRSVILDLCSAYQSKEMFSRSAFPPERYLGVEPESSECVLKYGGYT